MTLLNFIFTCVALCNAVFLCILHADAATYQKPGFLEEDLIIDAGELGKIGGVSSSTIGPSPRSYISFQGMRYAESPIGSQRFLPSIRSRGKLNSSGEIFYAAAPSPACSQPQSGPLPVVTSEDCLTVNVYTPQPYTGNDEDLLPVIFFIHGGSFTVGQGSMFNGKRLLNRDVVVVSCNYRLGVLGFFSLNTENVPGNAALYDVINALKWTKDFIKYFGGDPQKITIAGQSAGSVVVTHLLTSPAAQGLFQGAIAASGTALAAWGTTEDPFNDSLRIAELSACYNRDLGYPNDTMIATITTCMRNASPDQLIASLYLFQIEERKQGRLGFAAVSPTLQLFKTTTPDFEKVVPEHPKNVLESKRQANVPLMMGATRHDGSYVLGVYYNRFLKENNYVNETHSDNEFMATEAIPRILQALGIPNEYGVYNTISKLYLGESRQSGNFWEMYPGLIDLFSVFFFKASSYQTALYHSTVNNSFWYSFDYQGRYSVFETLFGDEVPPFESGITHGDDLIYLFQLTLLSFNEEERSVSERVLDYWANFATFGTPTTNDTWHPLTVDEAYFLSIGEESAEMQHYDDTWSDVSWELIPTTTTTTTKSSDTPSGNDAPLASSKYLIVLFLMSSAIVNCLLN